VTTKRFKSAVVRHRTKTHVLIPFDPNEVWGGKDRYYVKGTVGGRPIRGLLRLDGEAYVLVAPGHRLADRPALSQGDLRVEQLAVTRDVPRNSAG